MNILTRLAAEAEDFSSGLRDHPISSSVTPSEIRDHLAERYGFDRPQPPDGVFTDVTAMFRRWTEHSTHPRYFGLFVPGVETSGVVADALTALYNPQLATWEMAPAANEIERWTLRVLLRAFGFDPETGMANFTTGGSEANHTAIMVALTQRFPEFPRRGWRAFERPPVLYLSEEGHHSFEKIAHMTSLGRDSVRFVPADSELRLDVDALEEKVQTDRARGREPFLVVGTAGTTNAGVIDPLAQMADFCRREGLWFHVDAAWGGAAALSDRLRPHLDGIELADSITCDAHKWLSVPAGAGMFFCRHPREVERTFEVETAYVPDRTDDGRTYPLATTPQWGRRCIGLKLFMMLAEHGVPGIAKRLERQTRLGEVLRQRLAASGWRLLNSTPLPVVCFHHPRLAAAGVPLGDFVRSVTGDQIGWISKTTLRGHTPALRACITNLDTEERDVEDLVAGLDRTLDTMAPAVEPVAAVAV